MKAKFSIRYKFLAVTAVLLVVCVGAYLALAIKEFKNDKRSLVFDYNQSLVVNTASDLESFLSSLADKMRLLALFHREPEAKRKMWIADLMRDKGDLVFIAGSQRFTDVDQVYYEDAEFLKTYGLSEKFWRDELLKKRPVPLKKIQLEGEVVWNATIEDGAPLIGFGQSVIEEDANGVPVNQFAVIGFVKADRLIKALAQGKPNEVYVATRDGEILAHAKPEVMAAGALIVPDVIDEQKQNREGAQARSGEGAQAHSGEGAQAHSGEGAQAHSGESAQAQNEEKTHTDKLVQLAAASQVKKKVMEFVDGQHKYLAAFAHAFNGQVLVLSKISEARAFRAVNRLVFNSLIFASMIVTLAFLVAIFFSRSLTRPIDVLIQGMDRVSDGDLNTHIDVQSRDEIAQLAHSFNSMIVDLKTSRHELEEINRELENKVKERTLELESQNRVAREAQEALLRTTRLAAVGEVAGQAAHEVLNPLTTIISRLNKVKERLGQDRVQELQVLLDINSGWSKDFTDGGFQKLVKSWQTPSMINTGQNLWDEDLNNIKQVGENTLQEFKNLLADSEFLLQEAERIGRIVTSFRSLSTYRGEPTELALHKVCTKSVQIMADMATRDQITLKTDWQATDDNVLADEDEFIQVMTNLLRNALQSVRKTHSGQSTGTIRVETTNANGQIEVHVIDNGQGVAEEHKTKLFEKNFTTKTKMEGTGIGLAISRRLIRAFKGDITLRDPTKGNRGAHFVVSIPLYKKNANERGAA